MKGIESLEQWTALSAELSTHGYQRWQIQYGTDYPEGFHTWFWASDRPVLEIVTHSDAVHDAIVKYR